MFFQFLQKKKKKNEIHFLETRLTEKSIYFPPRVTKSFGQLLLSYRDVKLWNSIHHSIKKKYCISFKKSFKDYLLSIIFI